jgi:single-strand DNA-binding protein
VAVEVVVMNVAVLCGTLSRAPEVRELPSGDRLVAYEVTVRPPQGKAESVPVAWPDAPAWAGRFPAGADVVVVGRVRRRFFRAGGATSSRTEVVARAVRKTGTAAARKAVQHAAAELVAGEGASG